MMFMKQILLFTTIFVVLCASKEQTQNSGFAPSSDHSISGHHTIYGQPMQDNIAAETELAKRGASSSTSTTGASSESQGQSSQIEVGTGGTGSSGVISYSTPNAYQQFYSPSFGHLGAYFAAQSLPTTSGAASPQIFYVRAPAQYVAPSGVGSIKFSYSPDQQQPTTTIQYAATAPKLGYTLSSPSQYASQYPLAYTTQPNAYSYAPLGIASPYTTSAYTTPNTYGTGPIAAATLQQGQIIPYTTAANSLFLNPSAFQQLYNGFTMPQTLSAAGTVQPLTAYTTASPVVPSVPKIGSTVVTPTSAAFYASAPASQTYQQSPTFLSYANVASPLNYATAQKLFAVPSYAQAYRSIVAPTAATSTSAYTSALIQPTGSAPVKYSLTQPQSSYYTSAASSYSPKLYAPSATVTGTASTPFASAVQQSLNQAIAAQASTSTNAIQYASPPLYTSSLTATKYGYSQLPTPQKYFYAST